MHDDAFAGPAVPGATPRRSGRLLVAAARRFGSDARGTTAVEVGLAFVPFVALILAFIETMLILVTTGVMDNAVEAASRRLYTGQFQQANAGTAAADLAGKFRTEFCTKFWGLSPCSTVRIDVRAYDSFPTDVASPVVKDAGGKFVVDPNFGQFTQPKRSQIVLVRAAVENPVLMSLLNPNQTNLSNGKRLIVGSYAFRSEPF